MGQFGFLPLLGAESADARLVALLEGLGVRRRPERPSSAEASEVIDSITGDRYDQFLDRWKGIIS